MDAIGRIKELCRKKGTSIAKIEKLFGYGNGSLAKSKDIPSFRMYEIAQYFHVPMEYIVAGVEPPEPALSFEDKAILDAYHKQPDAVKTAICDMLHVKRDLLLSKEA